MGELAEGQIPLHAGGERPVELRLDLVPLAVAVLISEQIGWNCVEPEALPLKAPPRAVLREPEVRAVVLRDPGATRGAAGRVRGEDVRRQRYNPGVISRLELHIAAIAL